LGLQEPYWLVTARLGGCRAFHMPQRRIWWPEERLLAVLGPPPVECRGSRIQLRPGGGRGRDCAAPQRACPTSELRYTVVGVATVWRHAHADRGSETRLSSRAGHFTGQVLRDGGREACPLSCGVPDWGSPNRASPASPSTGRPSGPARALCTAGRRRAAQPMALTIRLLPCPNLKADTSSEALGSASLDGQVDFSLLDLKPGTHREQEICTVHARSRDDACASGSPYADRQASKDLLIRTVFS
jgi:hypothetical protein